MKTLKKENVKTVTSRYMYYYEGIEEIIFLDYEENYYLLISSKGIKTLRYKKDWKLNLRPATKEQVTRVFNAYMAVKDIVGYYSFIHDEIISMGKAIYRKGVFL